MKIHIKKELGNIGEQIAVEYLIKNNYVDKAGNPSFEVFKQSCNLKAEDIYSILQNSNNKGVNM